jgi:drug/metabolite transporter (DMT)-like permease
MNARVIDWLHLFYLSLAWGASFMLIAVALDSFGPLTVVALRMALGALVLYCVMRLRGLDLPRERTWWGRFAVLALTGSLVPFWLIAWGETHIASSLAGILMALMPISVLLLAHFALQNEPITPRRAAGFALGFVGVVVLVGAEVLGGLGGPTLLAQLGIVLATFFYALNSVLSKRLPSIDVTVVGAGTLIAGTAMILPIALVVDRPWTVEVSAVAMLAVTVLGVFSTGIALWVFFSIIARRGPGFLSMINYMIPVVAFAAGVSILGEPASPQKFIGLAAILVGIFVGQTGRRS